MKKFFGIIVLLGAIVLSGCTRVETGEVGLRQGFDKTIQKTELMPGSFNQTIMGDVLLFPVKQIGLQLDNIKPQTKDNSTLADMDVTVVYNINPSSVGDLYTTEAHTFNAIDSKGQTLLMYNYLMTVSNSASFKAVNKFDALDVSKNRDAIEKDIAVIITEAIAAKKLDMAITIAQVQIKSILPDASIIASANAVITAQNAQRAAAVAVGTAKLEAERNDYLSRPTNLQFMRAKAELNISEAALAGHVNAILIPHGMTMFGGVGKGE